MHGNKINSLIVLAAASLLFSCKPSVVSDSKAYYSYLANPENGLVKEKAVSGIKYKIKYLPQDYLVYSTINNASISERMKDSITKSYDNSLTFLLNIGPDKKEDFDITTVGLSSYKEFAERIGRMAFESADWISLQAKDSVYRPSIVKLENLNDLEKSRNFIVVFPSQKGGDEDLRGKDLCFEYEDALFNTGINKFYFKGEDINDVPKFKF